MASEDELAGLRICLHIKRLPERPNVKLGLQSFHKMRTGYSSSRRSILNPRTM